MVAEKIWQHKNVEIEEGLKPGSKHFQYFYVVSEGGKKKGNYCVWIVDSVLSRFEPSGDFVSIASSQRETWNKWVKSKIDEGDFRNKALRFGPDGEKEIELSEMSERLSVE